MNFVLVFLFKTIYFYYFVNTIDIFCIIINELLLHVFDVSFFGKATDVSKQLANVLKVKKPTEVAHQLHLQTNAQSAQLNSN